MNYIKRNGPRGRSIYFLDGKLVSAKSIPQNELDKLNGAVVETTPVPKVCIFCGEYGTEEKFINLQTLYLCNEDYLNKTSGEIVHQLNKEKSSA